MTAKQRRIKQRKIDKFFSILAVFVVVFMLSSVLVYAAVEGGNNLSERMGLHSTAPRQAQDAVVLPHDIYESDTHISFIRGEENGNIDYSNTSDGYVMVRCESDRQARFIMEKDGQTYYEYLPADGNYHAFPLTYGDGAYSVRISLQSKGTLYDRMVEGSFEVEIMDEFTRFLIPTPLAPFNTESELVDTAREMYSQTQTDFEYVEAAFRYVSDGIHYDKDLVELAETTGYVPDGARALEEGRGICTDFASAFALMMRSCGIPCKIIYGDFYTADGARYHAWNMVWLDDGEGGGSWWRYDATNGIGGVEEGGAEKIYMNFKSAYGEPKSIN